MMGEKTCLQRRKMQTLRTVGAKDPQPCMAHATVGALPSTMDPGVAVNNAMDDRGWCKQPQQGNPNEHPFCSSRRDSHIE